MKSIPQMSRTTSLAAAILAVVALPLQGSGKQAIEYASNRLGGDPYNIAPK